MPKPKRGKKRLSYLRIKLDEEIAKARSLLIDFPNVTKESIRNAAHQIETVSSPKLIIEALEQERKESGTNLIFGDSAA